MPGLSATPGGFYFSPPNDASLLGPFTPDWSRGLDAATPDVASIAIPAAEPLAPGIKVQPAPPVQGKHRSLPLGGCTAQEVCAAVLHEAMEVRSAPLCHRLEAVWSSHAAS